MGKSVFYISLGVLIWLGVKLCISCNLVEIPVSWCSHRFSVYSVRGKYGAIKNDTIQTYVFPVGVPNPVKAHCIKREIDLWMSQYPELDDSTNRNAFPLNRQNLREFRVRSVLRSDDAHCMALLQSKRDTRQVYAVFFKVASACPFRTEELEIKVADGNWRKF